MKSEKRDVDAERNERGDMMSAGQHATRPRNSCRMRTIPSRHGRASVPGIARGATGGTAAARATGLTGVEVLARRSGKGGAR